MKSPIQSRRIAGLCALAVLGLPLAAAASPYEHVLYLSIDGLHESDLADPALQDVLTNIRDLEAHGVRYSNCFTPGPTDSFPGVMAEFTGASPKTTGIYYDHAYSRSLYAPGVTLATLPPSPGTVLDSTGSIDFNSSLLGGGSPSGSSDGTFSSASINPASLPQRLVNGALVPVYPHELLQVNTVFDVAHAAGLRTAYIDKHMAYDLVKGPTGTGVDDFYAAESDAKVKIEGTGATAHLVDAFTTTTGTSGLKKISGSVTLSNAYDDLRLGALMNQVDGRTALGGAVPGNVAPAVFGMNFVALGNAQRLSTGGIDPTSGASADLRLALGHIDASVGLVVSELKARGLWDTTLVVLTAKHGNSPRVGFATDLASNTYTDVLTAAGVGLASVQQDSSLLYWLTDPSQTAKAKAALAAMPNNHIDTIYAGSAELLAAGFGDPAHDDRTPDLIVKLQPGYIISDSVKRAEHGGFSDDDSHVALVMASGGLDPRFDGTMELDNVSSTQIAVTTLEALGLNPALLQGATIEGTQVLPGLGLPSVPEPSGIAFLGFSGAALLSVRRRHGRARH